MDDTGTPPSVVGGGVLGLVTGGTYDNPLAIYREYIQNAADAAAGRVEIEIDQSEMRVRIRDDGPGLSADEALRSLLPIAHSRKDRGTHRGFRGIGRLSGLAFAETVTFLTRTRRNDPVSRIVWNGPRLRADILRTQCIERTLRNVVTVEAICSQGYPDHFFDVEISGVARHAAGLMLNREAVRTYIAEVCPVPLSGKFTLATKVDELLYEATIPLTLEIILDGESAAITRRYADTIHFSDTRKDSLSEFQKIDIPSADGRERAAIGWIAHSSYLGAIPKEAGIRGIRVREGNIQIGGEAVFDALFSEARFNRWCVGEVHILDPRITPNSRRDYFEPGPHTRNLENRMAAVLHGIEARCRKASSTRNRRRRLHSAIQEIEETYDLAASGYLASADAKALIERASSRIPTIRRQLGAAEDYAGTGFRDISELEIKLQNFKIERGHSLFSSMSKREVATFHKIFHALTQSIESPRVAREIIESILDVA